MQSHTRPDNASWYAKVNAIISRWFGLRIVRQENWERLEILAYRNRLIRADERGDADYLQAEAAKHQLGQRDMQRLEKYETPIESWPDEEGLIVSDQDTPRAE
jgi:hypothetical protein